MGNQELAPWQGGGALDYGAYAKDKVVVKLDKMPIIHLVQNNSPEFDAGSAQPGDTVLRVAAKGDPGNPNLGKTWRGIVVARGVQYLWWGDREEGGGAPLARMVKGDPVPAGCDPKDLLWPDRGGNVRPDDKRGPVADETHTFLVCPFKDGEVGPAALLTYSRGSIKAGEGVQQLLNSSTAA